MWRAWCWPEESRARVVGAALIQVSMAYSITGRTKPLYTAVQQLGSRTLEAFWRKPSRCDPRTARHRICAWNESCRSKSTPRSSSRSTSGTAVPWKVMRGRAMGVRWCEITSAWDFDGSNFIRKALPQSASALTACCRTSVPWRVPSLEAMQLYKVVSSAHTASCVSGGRWSSASFVYRRKRVGPYILPWGTQDLIVWVEEYCPPTTTRIFRSWR